MLFVYDFVNESDKNSEIRNCSEFCCNSDTNLQKNCTSDSDQNRKRIRIRNVTDFLADSDLRILIRNANRFVNESVQNFT